MPAALEKPWSVIAAQAASGVTLDELSRHHDISLGTLKDRCAREGWKRTAREVSATKAGGRPAHPQSGSIQPRPTEQALSVMDTLDGRNKLAYAVTSTKIAERFSEMDPDELIACTPAVKDGVSIADKTFGWTRQAQEKQAALVQIAITGCPSVSVGSTE